MVDDKEMKFYIGRRGIGVLGGVGDCSGGAGTIDPDTGLVCLNTSGVTVATPAPGSISQATLNNALNQAQVNQEQSLDLSLGPSTYTPCLTGQGPLSPGQVYCSTGTTNPVAPSTNPLGTTSNTGLLAAVAVLILAVVLGGRR